MNHLYFYCIKWTEPETECENIAQTEIYDDDVSMPREVRQINLNG